MSTSRSVGRRPCKRSRHRATISLSITNRLSRPRTPMTSYMSSCITRWWLLRTQKIIGLRDPRAITLRFTSKGGIRCRIRMIGSIRRSSGKPIFSRSRGSVKPKNKESTICKRKHYCTSRRLPRRRWRNAHFHHGSKHLIQPWGTTKIWASRGRAPILIGRRISFSRKNIWKSSRNAENRYLRLKSWSRMNSWVLDPKNCYSRKVKWVLANRHLRIPFCREITTTQRRRELLGLALGSWTSLGMVHGVTSQAPT